MQRSERPAGLGWRIGARVVDGVAFAWIVLFVMVEIDQRLLGGDPLGQRQARVALDSARSIVILVVLILLYEVLPALMYGATPGKALLGLRVRLVNPDVPVALAVLGRAAVLYGPPILLGPLGSVVPLVLVVSVVFAKNGRGLHDRLLGTLVVSVAREED